MNDDSERLIDKFGAVIAVGLCMLFMLLLILIDYLEARSKSEKKSPPPARLEESISRPLYKRRYASSTRRSTRGNIKGESVTRMSKSSSSQRQRIFTSTSEFHPSICLQTNNPDIPADQLPHTLSAAGDDINNVEKVLDTSECAGIDDFGETFTDSSSEPGLNAPGQHVRNHDIILNPARLKDSQAMCYSVNEGGSQESQYWCSRL